MNQAVVQALTVGITIAVVLTDATMLHPPDWTGICQSKFTGNASKVAISCHVTAAHTWDFNIFRNWSALLDNSTKVSVDIVCDAGGRVCLPWPYRAANLDSLKVRKCANVCKMKDYARPDVLETIPDTLRVFEGYDITVHTSISELLSAKNRTPALDCGSLSIETYIYQGASYHFVSSELDISLLNNTNITDRLTARVKDIGNQPHRCSYRNMRVYDVSRKVHASSSSLYALIVNSYFPELQILNLSSTELQSFPSTLKAWYRRLPKLKTLDLSHNNISRFHLTTGLTSSSDSSINLTHNNIETIGSAEIESFAYVDGVLDIRKNPLRCDCTMADFSDFLRTHESPIKAHINADYSYLWTLTCVSPVNFQGRRIAELSRDTLCNNDVTAYKATVGVLVSAAVVLVFVAVIVFICRHRNTKKSPDSKSKPKSDSRNEKDDTKFVPQVINTQTPEYV